MLHSPAYRVRYADYLKSDFARIPLPGSRALFEALVSLGTQLVALHLFDAEALPILKDAKGIRLAGSGEARVAHKPEYEAKLGRVMINTTRWFEAVPQVAWDFHVGGYQPAQKWLKDRRQGRQEGQPWPRPHRRRRPSLSSNDRRPHPHRRADAANRRGRRAARRLVGCVSRHERIGVNEYPDGFIVPLAYGLRALLQVDANGQLAWKTDPTDFIDRCLDEIVRKYKVLIQAFGGDAQKIGKNEGSLPMMRSKSSFSSSVKLREGDDDASAQQRHQAYRERRSGD